MIAHPRSNQSAKTRNAGNIYMALKRLASETSSFQQAFCKEFSELVADDMANEAKKESEK